MDGLTIFSPSAAVGEHELTILDVSVAPMRAWVDHLAGGMSNGLTTVVHLLPLRGLYVLTTFAASVAPGRVWVDRLLCMHLPPLGRAWVPWVDPLLCICRPWEGMDSMG